MRKHIKTILKLIPFTIGVFILVIGLSVKSASDIIYPERISQLASLPNSYTSSNDTITNLYNKFSPIISNANVISFYAIIIAIILFLISILLMRKTNKKPKKCTK